MKIIYKIISIADGTFELFKQIDGISVRTMGNFSTEVAARKKKQSLEGKEDDGHSV